MKISIFTTCTNPIARQDPIEEALRCYRDLADELVLIDGGKPDNYYTNTLLNTSQWPGHQPTHPDKVVYSQWPDEYNFKFFGEQFQRGYEACSGDWVIKVDLDFFFHENDMDKIRTVLDQSKDEPMLSFFKHQFILPDRYSVKSRLLLALNKKKFGDRIKLVYGEDEAQPGLDGEYIPPDSMKKSGIPFYNYDYTFKDKELLLKETGRYARAWWNRFGSYAMGGPDDESAFGEFMKMWLVRLTRAHNRLTLDEHPKYIKEKLKNLHPGQLGYNLFGNSETCSYFTS